MRSCSCPFLPSLLLTLAVGAPASAQGPTAVLDNGIVRLSFDVGDVPSAVGLTAVEHVGSGYVHAFGHFGVPWIVKLVDNGAPHAVTEYFATDADDVTASQTGNVLRLRWHGVGVPGGTFDVTQTFTLDGGSDFATSRIEVDGAALTSQSVFSVTHVFEYRGLSSAGSSCDFNVRETYVVEDPSRFERFVTPTWDPIPGFRWSQPANGLDCIYEGAHTLYLAVHDPSSPGAGLPSENLSSEGGRPTTTVACAATSRCSATARPSPGRASRRPTGSRSEPSKAGSGTSPTTTRPARSGSTSSLRTAFSPSRSSGAPTSPTT